MGSRVLVPCETSQRHAAPLSFGPGRRFIGDVTSRQGHQSRPILAVSDMVTADAESEWLNYIAEKFRGIVRTTGQR